MITKATITGKLYVNDLGKIARPQTLFGPYIIEQYHRVPRLSVVMDLPSQTISDRLRKGSRCFVAVDSFTGYPVGWFWVSIVREYIRPLNWNIRLAPDECYGWGAEVLEEHRGLGLFKQILSMASYTMLHMGYRWMWNGIEDENTPSVRAHAAVGFKPIVSCSANFSTKPTTLTIYDGDISNPSLLMRAYRMLSIPASGVWPAQGL